MIYINDREVTTYFTDKNYIQNLSWVMGGLHKILCEKMGVECTPSTEKYFIEALVIYVKANFDSKASKFSDKRLNEIIRISENFRAGVGCFDVLIDGNEELSNDYVRKFMKTNSRSFNEILSNLYANYEFNYNDGECPHCQYNQTAMIFLMTYIENISSFKIPFSINLMEELMMFCKKNGRKVF